MTGDLEYNRSRKFQLINLITLRLADQRHQISCLNFHGRTALSFSYSEAKLSWLSFTDDLIDFCQNKEKCLLLSVVESYSVSMGVFNPQRQVAVISLKQWRLLASVIETTEVLNCTMAKEDSSPNIVRKESIADLVDDLKLLRVSVDGYRAASGMEMARKERIKELKKANGTLSEVC